MASERKLIQHVFRERYCFQDGDVDLPTKLLSNECGFVTDAMLNSTSFGPEHCNRPRSEHIEDPNASK